MDFFACMEQADFVSLTTTLARSAKPESQMTPLERAEIGVLMAWMALTQAQCDLMMARAEAA